MPDQQIDLSAAKPGECYRDREGNWSQKLAEGRDPEFPHACQCIEGGVQTYRHNGRFYRDEDGESGLDLIAPFLSPDGGVYQDSEGREWEVGVFHRGVCGGTWRATSGESVKYFDATGKSVIVQDGKVAIQLVRYLRPLPVPTPHITPHNPATPHISQSGRELPGLAACEAINAAIRANPNGVIIRSPSPPWQHWRATEANYSDEPTDHLIVDTAELPEAQSNHSPPSESSQPEPVQLREGVWEDRLGDVEEILSCVGGIWYGRKRSYLANGRCGMDRERDGDLIRYLGQRTIVSDEELDHLESVRACGGVTKYLNDFLSVSDAEAAHLSEVRAAGGVEAWCEQKKNLHMALASGMRFAASDRTDDEAGWHQSLAPGEILASDGETPGVFAGPDQVAPEDLGPSGILDAERGTMVMREPQPVVMREGWWRLRCGFIVPVLKGGTAGKPWGCRDFPAWGWSDDGRFYTAINDKSPCDALEYLGPLDGVPVVLSAEEAETRVRAPH